MKKNILTIALAFFGGALVLITEKYFFKDNSQNAFQQQSPVPVKFVSNSGNPVSDFTFAAEQSLNAVVHIKTVSEEQVNNLSYDPFRHFFFGTPQQRIQQGSGSGVIISKDGYIVTNNHVVNGSSSIEVVLNDKRSYKAELIGKDPQTDLAVLKISQADLPYILYGNSDAVKVGEWALAVGNPFNLTSTVTAGIISAKGRNINLLENDPNSGIFPIESFIQTDAAVNPGNSGGALVNTGGELIGINTAIASQTGSYSGYAFAIPVNIVKKVVADLIEFGAVQRAFIGVSIRDIDSKFAKEKNISNLNGVYVNGVTDGGAGEQAGLKQGDIITKIENNPVKNVAELQEQVGKYRPGDKIKVGMSRKGEDVILELILRNKEGNLGIIRKLEKTIEGSANLGATFEELSKEDLKKVGLMNGLKVSKLEKGKLASAGIQQGFIITSVDRKKINTIQDLESALKQKEGGVLIEGIYPNGVKAYYGFGL